ncbi:MAG: tRNA lysidine(34) synthetase TilS [Candidatus Gastranaerophilales bacterium]|nr:tRNA lysidine(34) synthetase TilS [Candidatus Gastranaerophilales bacterium]
MKETVRNILEKYVKISCESTFIVGFSGGWDSMCLLDIMNKLSKEYGFLLVAAHLNHNWRGKESEAEKERCLAFCEENDITFISDTLAAGTKASELIAREMRYDFFKRCAEEFEADAILTAHTKSDNAETILYRIIKGTGLNGLEGIREIRDLGGFKVIRPILNFSRKDIEEYCIKNELYPNNDSSNTNTKYARNNIRHNIMPAVKHINPNIENALITLADIAAGNNKIISELIQNIENQITAGDKWHTQNFLILNSAIKQHFIYKLLVKNEIEPAFSKIQELINFITENQKSKTGKTLSVAADKWLFVSSRYIYFVYREHYKKIEDEITVNSEGSFNFGGMFKITIEKYNEKVETFPKSASNTAYVVLDEAGFPFTLRTRRNGDIIQPFGMQGKMKLKKYFINKNIPEHDRDKTVLLCKNNEVLWAAGIGLSEKLRTKNLPQYRLKMENIKNADD